jgi:hypothetical protein
MRGATVFKIPPVVEVAARGDGLARKSQQERDHEGCNPDSRNASHFVFHFILLHLPN